MSIALWRVHTPTYQCKRRSSTKQGLLHVCINLRMKQTPTHFIRIHMSFKYTHNEHTFSHADSEKETHVHSDISKRKSTICLHEARVLVERFVERAVWWCEYELCIRLSICESNMNCELVHILVIFIYTHLITAFFPAAVISASSILFYNSVIFPPI